MTIEFSTLHSNTYKLKFIFIRLSYFYCLLGERSGETIKSLEYQQFKTKCSKTNEDLKRRTYLGYSDYKQYIDDKIKRKCHN